MIVVDQGQSLFDIAIQHCGSTTAAFDLAKINGISPTDRLKAGTKLKPAPVVDQSMVKYFKDNGYVPATDVIESGNVEVLKGIGYWSIGVDFIVS